MIRFDPMAISGCGINLWADRGLELTGSEINAITSQADIVRRYAVPTGATAPELKQDGINGRAAIMFDGVQDRLEILDDGFGRNSPGLTLVAVHKPTETSGSRVIYSAKDVDSNGWRARLSVHYDADNQFDCQRRDDGDYEQIAGGQATINAQVFIAVADFFKRRMAVYRDGILLAESIDKFASSSNSSDTNSPQTWVGAGVYSGRYAGLLGYLGGWPKALNSVETDYLTLGLLSWFRIS